MDDDLASALDYNPQDEWGRDDIDQVLAVVEGERDERDWHWVVLLKDGRYLYVRGWCDYTGWDCKSGLDARVAESAFAAAELARVPEYEWKIEEAAAASDELARQLREGREKTSREKVGEVLGLADQV